jgi:hypothetical protein
MGASQEELCSKEFGMHRRFYRLGFSVNFNNDFYVTGIKVKTLNTSK